VQTCVESDEAGGVTATGGVTGAAQAASNNDAAKGATNRAIIRPQGSGNRINAVDIRMVHQDHSRHVVCENVFRLR